MPAAVALRSAVVKLMRTVLRERPLDRAEFIGFAEDKRVAETRRLLPCAIRVRPHRGCDMRTGWRPEQQDACTCVPSAAETYLGHRGHVQHALGAMYLGLLNVC